MGVGEGAGGEAAAAGCGLRGRRVHRVLELGRQVATEQNRRDPELDGTRGSHRTTENGTQERKVADVEVACQSDAILGIESI